MLSTACVRNGAFMIVWLNQQTLFYTQLFDQEDSIQLIRQ